MALTDTEIRKARPTARPYKLADSGGLFLMIMPTGGKLWPWKYCFDGKEKLMALGFRCTPLEVERQHKQ